MLRFLKFKIGTSHSCSVLERSALRLAWLVKYSSLRSGLFVVASQKPEINADYSFCHYSSIS